MPSPVLLTDVTNRLLTLTDLRLSSVLHEIIRGAMRLFDSVRGGVCIPDHTGGSCIKAYALHPETNEALPPAICDQCPQCADGCPAKSVTHLPPDKYFFRIFSYRPFPGAFCPENAPFVCVLGDSDDPNPNALTNEQLELFAQISGLALENALRDEQQSILHRAATVFATERAEKVDELAAAIAERMCFEACSILTVTKDTSKLRIVGTTGLSTDASREHWTFHPDEAPRDPTAHIIGSNELLALNDLDANQRYEIYEPLGEALAAREGQQFLGVPVPCWPPGRQDPEDTNPIGVLRVRNKLGFSGSPGRPIDWLDVIEAQLIARAIGPVLSAVETEIIRSEAITRTRHDMYEPINMIRDAAGEWAKHGVTAVQQRATAVHETLQIIGSLCHVLYAHVNQSRVLSYRDVKYDFRKLPLRSAIIVKLVKLFAAECTKYHLGGISATGFEDFPHLYLDEKMMHVVFYNLFNNAVKYSSPGKTIRVSGSHDETWFYIHVSNEGVGIDETDRERVFEKWYRTERVANQGREGLGLGLYHVREIIARHGGTATVTRLSDPTRITIRLPKSLANRRPT